MFGDGSCRKFSHLVVNVLNSKKNDTLGVLFYPSLKLILILPNINNQMMDKCNPEFNISTNVLIQVTKQPLIVQFGLLL